jgi:hypothetical protein
MAFSKLMFRLFAFASFASVICASNVTVAYFTDYYCNNASPLNPNVSVALDVCVNSPGLVTVEFPSTPCSVQYVQLYGYKGSNCDGDPEASAVFSPCWQMALNNEAMGSFRLSCTQTDPPPPSSTITIPARAVASGEAAPSAVPSGSSSGSTSNGGSSQSSSTGSTDNSSSSSSSGWNSFSSGAKVGIILGPIGGVAGVIIIIRLITGYSNSSQNGTTYRTTHQATTLFTRPTVPVVPTFSINVNNSSSNNNNNDHSYNGNVYNKNSYHTQSYEV